MKNANEEKDSIRENLNIESEFKMKDLENKLKMLENKCNYFERLNQLATSKKVTSSGASSASHVGITSNGSSHDDEVERQLVAKKLHQDLLGYLSQIEALTDTNETLQVNLKRLSEDYEMNQEKLRQTEDLLMKAQQMQVNSFAKQSKVEANSRASLRTLQRELSKEQCGEHAQLTRDESIEKLIIIEQCVDEILLASSFKGANPSKMTIREKFVTIMNQIQNIRQELKLSNQKNDIAHIHIQRVESVRKLLENKYEALFLIKNRFNRKSTITAPT